jgi:hypothetical protein
VQPPRTLRSFDVWAGLLLRLASSRVSGVGDSSIARIGVTVYIREALPVGINDLEARVYRLDPHCTEEGHMAERNRRRIAVLIYSMVNAVLFGIGLLIVLLMPPFNAHLGLWIPIVVVVSFVLAAPIAWLVAPRLQARYDRKRQTEGQQVRREFS